MHAFGLPLNMVDLTGLAEGASPDPARHLHSPTMYCWFAFDKAGSKILRCVHFAKHALKGISD